jgi:hypothetical protein
MFSSPLHNLYPAGDFYVSDPNPVTDGFFVETMLFNVPNPETNLHTQGVEWTGSFNDSNRELRAGEGAAIWIDEKGTGYDDHDPQTFHFPKHDTFYYLYDPYGTPVGRRPDLDRTKKGRFIYEPLVNGEVQLVASPPGNAGSNYILVGNPFMAHLDFEKFHERNAGEIDDEYKIAIGAEPEGSPNEGKVRDFNTVKKVGTVYVSTDSYDLPIADLGSLIPPMQSFIVAAVNGKISSQLNLVANIEEHTTVKTGVTLRSAAESPMRKLSITASRDDRKSNALLLHFDRASSEYVSKEDSRKLFSNSLRKAVLVYTRSSDGYALDINSIGDLDKPIALGIHTSEKGPVLLSFDGMEDFRDEVIPVLYDAMLNTTTNLLQDNNYMFTKEEESLYVDNRFYIHFLPAGTEITAPVPAFLFSVVNPLPLTVRILSAEKPKHVRIWDIRGNILIDSANPQGSDTYHVNKPGIYIVRVTSEHGSEVKKTIIR